MPRSLREASSLRFLTPPVLVSIAAYIDESQVSGIHLVEALLIAIASKIAAGAYPAWRGAHLSPVEALRYE